jgi:hypothetical protein
MSASQFKMAMDCLEDYANENTEYKEDMLELLDHIQNYVDRLEEIINQRKEIDEGPIIADTYIAGWN